MQPNEFKVLKGCELYPNSVDTRKPMIKRLGLIIDAEYSVESGETRNKGGNRLSVRYAPFDVGI